MHFSAKTCYDEKQVVTSGVSGAKRFQPHSLGIQVISHRCPQQAP